MDDLIEALTIFRKYANSDYPTHCDHDVMYIMDVDPNDVSKADKDRLDQLGFFEAEDDECFMSFKFGSA